MKAMRKVGKALALASAGFVAFGSAAVAEEAAYTGEVIAKPRARRGSGRLSAVEPRRARGFAACFGNRRGLRMR